MDIQPVYMLFATAAVDRAAAKASWTFTHICRFVPCILAGFLVDNHQARHTFPLFFVNLRLQLVKIRAYG